MAPAGLGVRGKAADQHGHRIPRRRRRPSVRMDHEARSAQSPQPNAAENSNKWRLRSPARQAEPARHAEQADAKIQAADRQWPTSAAPRNHLTAKRHAGILRASVVALPQKARAALQAVPRGGRALARCRVRQVGHGVDRRSAAPSSK